MKTSELTGAALDWAVAKCEGVPVTSPDFDLRFINAYAYSTDWSHGGPIIEREKICPDYLLNGQWLAISRTTDAQGYGPTPLIAAMRCYVASKLGDNIDIPEELK